MTGWLAASESAARGGWTVFKSDKDRERERSLAAKVTEAETEALPFTDMPPLMKLRDRDRHSGTQNSLVT